jgi:hypothetical protein
MTPWILLSLIISFRAVQSDALGAVMTPATENAWNQYYGWADQKVSRELSDPQRFLIEDFLAPAEKAAIRKELEAGAIVVRRVTPSAVVPNGTHLEVPDGEIHHWWGAILIPKTTLADLIPFLQDYEHHAGKFADVEKSKLLSSDGNTFRFYFRLRRTKAFVTAQFNSEQECTYRQHSPARVSSRSVATRIAELENPGTTQEREKPPGNDRGFLWKLVSWWRFEQTASGVVVECESASLSRDIPTVVKFIPGVSSYIRSTPRESLESVLSSIRNYAPHR